MSDKMREEFESAYIATANGWSPDFRRYDKTGDYMQPTTYWAWWAWKASRETLVVELPPVPAEPEEPELAIDDSHMDAYHAAVRMRDSCVKAIEALGLKVKP